VICVITTVELWLRRWLYRWPSPGFAVLFDGIVVDACKKLITHENYSRTNENAQCVVQYL